MSGKSWLLLPVALLLLASAGSNAQQQPAAIGQDLAQPASADGQALNPAQAKVALQAAMADFRRTPPGTSDLDDVMDHLGELVEGIPARQVDRETLLGLISLLDLPGHPQAGALALMLQHFGTRARPAAPKLLAILRHSDCGALGMLNGDAIRITLRRMGVHPPPPHCGRSTFNPTL